MRIISVSRRTDIPAFYSRWLMNRLRAGFCHWINPFGGRVHRVSLAPDHCLALVLWTRDPAPLLPHMDWLQAEGYRCYFQFTINGYPDWLEPHAVPVATAVCTLRRVVERHPQSPVLWRYDPIVMSDRTPGSYHLQRFETVCRSLEGYTRRCTVSFVSLYGKTARNLGRLERQGRACFGNPSAADKRRLAGELAGLAAGCGMTLSVCCDPDLAEVDGIEPARCVDPDLVARMRPDLVGTPKPRPTRPGCGCVASTDIGAYDTCPRACAYCYATNSHRAARTRLAAHDPEDTVLWRPATLRGVDLSLLEQG